MKEKTFISKKCFVYKGNDVTYRFSREVDSKFMLVYRLKFNM